MIEKGYGFEGWIVIVCFDCGDGINVFLFEVLCQFMVVVCSFEDDVVIFVVVFIGSISVFSVGFDFKDFEGCLCKDMDFGSFC